MNKRIISEGCLHEYEAYLREAEKSPATIQKYMRDTRAFLEFSEGQEVSKSLVIAYKLQLQERGYAVRSINSMLAALNGLLEFLGWMDCRVKNLRCQRQLFCTKEAELTKAEYMRLLAAAKKREQLNLVLQTICATGIRISELRYFTVKAVESTEVCVCCKGKLRRILVPDKLRVLLMEYAERKQINSGAIFVTRNGKPLDRSNIWSQMKSLCREANVDNAKVYPHNLRKLFARTFYEVDKDIGKLADVLGHGSIETTRIYIMDTSAEHRRRLENMGLVT